APYMQPIRQYPRLLKSVAISFSVTLALMLQILPDINSAIGLVPMPRSMMFRVIGLAVGDLLLCFGIEEGAMFFLGPKPLKDELV
ncbi:hypothetical protein KIPB_012336, partial [Kipferlia bialata]